MTIDAHALPWFIIRHQNEEYHLRRTKNGKLILTK